MSSARFASITASLLARKGEAQPWSHVTAPDGDKASLPWRSPPPPVMNDPAPPPAINPAPPLVMNAPPPPVAIAAPPSPPAAKDRSCAVRMSQHDYERLGILAVKSAASRQQLLKDALAQFLDFKAQDYGCACLGECTQNCGSGG